MQPLGLVHEGAPPDGGKRVVQRSLWWCAKVWVAEGRLGLAKEAFRMAVYSAMEVGLFRLRGNLASLRPLRSEGGVSALRSAHNKSLQLDVGFAAAAELRR